MSDLAPADSATVPCPDCGGQNHEGARRCEFCGAALGAPGPAAAATEEIELDEAWRAAAAGGFDVDMQLTDGTVTCPVCATALPLAEVPGVAVQAVRDPVGPDEDLRVATLTCPSCGAAGRLVAPASAIYPVRRPATDDRDDEVDPIHDRVPGSTEDHPLGSDRQFFEPGRPGTLADQRPLLDEDGEDIRQYTGEPVETLEGWVIPQQQNVGPGNEAGGGEFPDPTTPPAQGRS